MNKINFRTNKKVLLFSLKIIILIIFFVPVAYASADFSCSSTTASSCSGVVLLRLSGGFDAHAELPNQSTTTYDNHVLCCTGVSGLNNSCSGNHEVFLRLSGDTNAHVEENTESNINYNGHDACVGAPVGDVISVFYGASCSGNGETLVSMERIPTNATVGDADAYNNKVCVKINVPSSNAHNVSGGFASLIKNIFNPTPTPTPPEIPTQNPPENLPQNPVNNPNSNQNPPVNNQPVINNSFSVKDIYNQSVEVVKNSFKNTLSLAFDLSQKVSGVVKTPGGSLVTKVVATAGIVVGGAVAFATVLFANPLSVSEIFLIPFRLWSLLLAGLGIKKRSVPWGTVYDSVTKQPLDPAYVIFQDLNGNEVATSITDIDGRYGFLVPPGQYRMFAHKTNYEFPSKKLSGKKIDELYNDLYFNEIIEVKEGEVISKNIPMDPIKFDWNEFAKKNQSGLMRFFSKRELLINRISNILFILGFIFCIIAVLVLPVFYNILIFSFYILMLILKNTIMKPRAYGYIKEKISRNPLSFAIIHIFFKDSQTEIMHRVADNTGKFYCLLSNGFYYVKIEKKNTDESYSPVFTSETIEVKHGFLNKNFEI